jgi:hypothetical protein
MSDSTCPTESRRRIGRWSRGLERIFEEVIKEGIAEREFRAALDPRMAALAYSACAMQYRVGSARKTPMLLKLAPSARGS